MKELRVGQIGTGFMGRTHSNAFLQVPHFFKTGFKPVLKCVCSLDIPPIDKILQIISGSFI